MTPRPYRYGAAAARRTAAAKALAGRTASPGAGTTAGMLQEAAQALEDSAALDAAEETVPDPAHPLGLSARQVEVLAHAADGLSNAEIGGRLFISEETVKVHMARAMALLGAVNRTGAVMTALRAGVVTASHHPLGAAVTFTYQEARVLQALADGGSNAEIAEALGLSALTVKSHLARLSRRMGAGDRTLLAVVAYTHRVIR